MSGDPSEEKNLPPADHHLDKLREKGNFPLSDDFHAAAASSIKVLVLYFGAATASSALMGLLKSPLEPQSPLSTGAIATDAISLFLIIFFTVSGLGIAANLAARGIDGGGLKPHFEKIAFKASDLNPVTGIKNKFKVRGLFELFKGVIKVAILAAGFGYIAAPHVGSIIQAAGCDIACSGPLIADLVLKFMVLFLVLQILAAMFDIKLVREVFKVENKMSRSDQTRENRDMNGDPEIKQEQTSFRHTLLESAGASGGNPGAARAPSGSEAVESQSDERRIVVFHEGRAVTISVNFSGEFKPVVLDRFDYRGDAPPVSSDHIAVPDEVACGALSNMQLGQPVPFHVMKRLLEVFSAR